MDLTNKVALITGCARGSGRATALLFADKGADILALDILPMEDLAGDIKAKGRRFFGFQADLSRQADVNRAVSEGCESLDGIDILIHMAGIAGPTKIIEEITDEEWHRTLDVNLTSLLHLSRAVIPVMKKRGGGSIVTVSSQLGLKGKEMRTPYVASKWAIIGVTRSMSIELGPFNIRTNTICPGTIEGERINEVYSKVAEAKGVAVESLKSELMARTPFGRMVRADEIASAALFLASDASSAVSGTELVVALGKA